MTTKAVLIGRGGICSVLKVTGKLREPRVKVSWCSHNFARAISSNSKNLLLSGMEAVSCYCTVRLLPGALAKTEVGEVKWVDTEGGTKMCVREFGWACKTPAFGTQEKSNASERAPKELSFNDLGTGGCELKL